MKKQKKLPFSALTIDSNIYLPLDITMQILGIQNPPLEQIKVVEIGKINFISINADSNIGQGFCISLPDNEVQVGVEKVLDKNGDIIGIKIVQICQ
ncbi:MAG: hypothetical protein GXW85_12780 [Clostridia bacterium]|nr:hypothetical protein [Clostridia bacterium]